MKAYVFTEKGVIRQQEIPEVGHEGLAEVLETGPEVRDFHPGELVAVSAVMPEVPDGTGHEGYPFSGSQLGRNRNGMWSERFYVPDADQNLGHIPKGLRPAQEREGGTP